MAAAKTDENRSGQTAAGETFASKSQLKREALAMKSLASDLLELSESQLARIPLDDDILQAIRQARQFRSHGAKRRQLQFIAKLIRRTDPDPLIRAVAAFKDEARGLTARQHRSEAWREALIESGDIALSELLRQRAGLNVQELRQIVRSARREHEAGRPSGAGRALFRVLRDLDAIQALPPCP